MSRAALAGLRHVVRPLAARRSRCFSTTDSGAALPDLPSQARVVVCGGGIVGTSVAYHLAKAGWTDVWLSELFWKRFESSDSLFGAF